MGYTPPCLFHLQVTSPSNFDFVLQWVSMSDFVGQPPTKKEVQANFKIFKNHIFWVMTYLVFQIYQDSFL